MKIISIPREIKIVILGIIYSFHIGKPTDEDLKYLAYYHSQEGEEPHKLLQMDAIYYLLTQNHKIKIDHESYKKYIFNLWQDGLIESPTFGDREGRKLATSLKKKGNFGVFSTSFSISLRGIQYLKKNPYKILKIESKSQKENILWLNQFGDLCRESKKKYCYPIGEKSERHKIVRYFAENKLYHYYPTREIALDLESKRTDGLMKTIGKINQMIQDKLNLKDNVIKGKRGSGYRINPKYKIILKND